MTLSAIFAVPNASIKMLSSASPFDGFWRNWLPVIEKAVRAARQGYGLRRCGDRHFRIVEFVMLPVPCNPLGVMLLVSPKSILFSFSALPLPSSKEDTPV